MPQHVIKVQPKDLQQVKRLILSDKRGHIIDTINEYEAFRIKSDGETIVAYTSGKIVCSGPRAEAVIQRVILELGATQESNDIVIGSDEAGKGEWLGPLVVAAVAVTDEQSRVLQSVGVMDSKEVPLRRLSKLAAEIESECSGKSVLLVSPETFNIRFKEMHDEGKNLNDFLAWGHAKVISDVYTDVASERKIRVVIDEFARTKARERLARVVPLERIDLVQRPRAEDEIAVAAASILARESREQWIDQYSKRMRVDLRELSVPEAYAHPDRTSFSKTEYLEKLSGSNHHT